MFNRVLVKNNIHYFIVSVNKVWIVERCFDIFLQFQAKKKKKKIHVLGIFIPKSLLLFRSHFFYDFIILSLKKIKIKRGKKNTNVFRFFPGIFIPKSLPII